jgi:hypothetical protein
MDSVNDELQRRINEHVLNGDAPSIIWAMERQIRINTELEAKVAELERSEALLLRFWQGYEVLGIYEGDPDLVDSFERIRGELASTYPNTIFDSKGRSLTEAGFPWTEEAQP